jgi:medium-chain acyl-[acyl-carrier-protein] hydrolase
LEHAELLQLLLPLIRADFALCETYTYTPEAPLSCSISAFGGLQDQDAPSESILAWNIHTSGAFQARFFAGGHFFLHQEQAGLLTALSQDLSRIFQSGKYAKQPAAPNGVEKEHQITN